MATGAPLNFNIGVINGLPTSSKINGNTVGDISDAYQLYMTGSAPSGSRVAGYATSAEAKYGFANAQDWAASYLQAAGIPILNNAYVGAAPSAGGTGTNSSTVSNPNGDNSITTPTVSTPSGTYGDDLNDLINSQYQNLAQAFNTAFGQAMYEPDLESQYYSGVPADMEVSDPSSLAGYESIPASATSTAGSTGDTTAPSSGISLETIVIIVAIGIAAYFGWHWWKKHHKKS